MEDMCRSAKLSGVREFGLSDHYVIPPYEGTNCREWRMPPERLEDYVLCLQALKKELDDETFTLRIGLEVDFFFENIDEVAADLKQYPLDYIIGSVHSAGVFSIDSDISYWDGLSADEISGICETYWKKLEGAASCGYFNLLGHLDLPKKFGRVPEPDAYFPHALRVLDAAAATGTPIELNTAGWFKECAEQYPALNMIRAAKERNIPVVINADAHSCKHITRAFDRAAEVIRQAGN